MSNSAPVSAVVITYNAEAHIARVLDALLLLTDDVVVIDSFSTDTTPGLCRERPVRFFQRPWPGYGLQKNFGNQQARHRYVLSVDADEVIDEALRTGIAGALASPRPAAAYRLRRRSYFGEKPILHGGWNPEWQMRLFDKTCVRWNTDPVHETLVLPPDAPVSTLSQGYLHHFTVASEAEFVAKTEHYACLFRQQGRRGGSLKRLISPPFRFLKEYVLKGGFLDGREGYIIARENARYTWLKYLPE